jgi:hypothetical protein
LELRAAQAADVSGHCANPASTEGDDVVMRDRHRRRHGPPRSPIVSVAIYFMA